MTHFDYSLPFHINIILKLFSMREFAIICSLIISTSIIVSCKHQLKIEPSRYEIASFLITEAARTDSILYNGKLTMQKFIFKDSRHVVIAPDLPDHIFVDSLFTYKVRGHSIHLKGSSSKQKS